MAAPIGGVWAIKSDEYQPTNFASTGAGIQAALDWAGGAVGSHVYIGPGDYTINSSITLYGKTTLKGAGALCTRLNLASGFTGVAMREKTSAEGNASGATGITVGELGIYGVSTASGGIDFGNQGGASFNANAQLWDLLVRDFDGGYCYKIRANAIHCRNIWAANCATGVWIFEGGASHFSGLWAEECSDTHLKVTDSAWNTFDHVQIEQSGGAPTGPLIDMASSSADRNSFFGIYMSIANNMTHLIIDRTGAVNNAYYGVRVVSNGGATYTNTIYAEGVTSGTGAIDWIGEYSDMSSSGKQFLRDQSSSELTTITGARPSYPQATITTINGTNATLTGDLTTGTTGASAASTFGQGTTGTDSSVIRIRSGSDSSAISQLLLRQNTTDQAGFRFVAGDTYIDYGGTLRLRAGLSGTQRATLTSAGAFDTASLSVNGGQVITKIISATASLNFDLTAVTTQDLTMTVTGAAVGDTVCLGIPNGSVTTSVMYTAWVSATDTVTVRADTLAVGENPASGTFRATVIQF